MSWNWIINLSNNFSHFSLNFPVPLYPNCVFCYQIAWSKLRATQLKELCCCLNSSWGWGLCARRAVEAAWRLPACSMELGCRGRAGPGSIWVPSCSPWPHSDKKQTNQHNKQLRQRLYVRAGQTVVMSVVRMYGLPQMTQGGNTGCFCQRPQPVHCGLTLLYYFLIIC